MMTGRRWKRSIGEFAHYVQSESNAARNPRTIPNIHIHLIRKENQMSQSKKTQSIPSRVSLGVTLDNIARALDLSGVRLEHRVTDQFANGTVAQFGQYALVGRRKLTVRGGYVRAHANSSGRIFSVNSSVRTGAKPKTLGDLISEERAVQLAKIRFGTNRAVVISSELMLSGDDDRLELVYEIVLARQGSQRIAHFLVKAATGEVVNKKTEGLLNGYPLGLDYAGGRPSGADLAAAGVTFVCRYVADGGRDLPEKLLDAEEASNLRANGRQIVINFESDGRMDGGFALGVADARTALANYLAAGGPPNPVIYFSVDYDAPAQDQEKINDYLRGAASVLGGPQFVGIYGGYWVVKRALDAGVCHFAWQTEAWSGGNVDPRINILQRNSLGYMNVDGVQCDYDEAHTDYFGQWGFAPANNSTSNITRLWTPRPFTKESCNSWAA
jgi:hypothetical protein